MEYFTFFRGRAKCPNSCILINAPKVALRSGETGLLYLARVIRRGLIFIDPDFTTDFLPLRRWNAVCQMVFMLKLDERMIARDVSRCVKCDFFAVDVCRIPFLLV